jgi:hypothetical protein
MEFKIEKDIPLPRRSKYSPLKEAAHSMVPGDSLLLDDRTARICAALIRRLFDGPGGAQRKAVTRKEGDMRRVRRTA